MVNFWASWCGPCEEEMPHLLEAYKKAEAKGFKLVLVSIDEPSDLEAANSFLKEAGVTFQTYYKGHQPPMFIQSLYPEWQGSVPATLLYGPDLKLLEAWEGEASPDELEQRIQRHLAATP
jgi:thiol-disulfide isomerase/thioredoxin